ncbi:transposase family protein [Bradyrhizobium yuanmingense]|uniref:transposase family protein n=1 Tax=Bradyrhizobium yuanmingense TaxID=108015 RepID=UPI0034DF4547
MDYRYRMTERLVERIRMEAVRRPVMAIAADCWVHEKTVRRILKDQIPQLTSRARTTEDDNPA